MKKIVVGLLAGTALVATACGSGGSAPPAAETGAETSTAVAELSRGEKIRAVQETAPDFDSGFVDLICDQLDPWTTETFYRDYGELYHYGDGYGTDPVQAQWMVDQATHIDCKTGMADAAPVWE